MVRGHVVPGTLQEEVGFGGNKCPEAVLEPEGGAGRKGLQGRVSLRPPTPTPGPTWLAVLEVQGRPVQIVILKPWSCNCTSSGDAGPRIAFKRAI